MRYVEAGLKALLDQDSTIKTMLEGTSEVSINRTAEDIDYKGILIEQTNWTPTRSKDGPKSPDRYIFAISCWNEDLKKAKDLMYQVGEVLNGYSGTIDEFNLSIRKDSMTALREDQITPEGLHGETHDYFVTHKY